MEWYSPLIILAPYVLLLSAWQIGSAVGDRKSARRAYNGKTGTRRYRVSLRGKKNNVST